MPEYTPYPGESQSAFQRRMLGRLAGGERLGMLGMARGTRGGLLPGVGGYQPPTGSGSAIASLMGEGPSSDIARVGGNFISRSGASQAAPAPPVPTGIAMPDPRLNPSNTGIAMPQLGLRNTGIAMPDYFPSMGPPNGSDQDQAMSFAEGAYGQMGDPMRDGSLPSYQSPAQRPTLVGEQTEADIEPVAESESTEVPDDPQGFMSKVGSFFTRPTTSQALMSAGAAMMSGRDAQGKVYGNALESVGAGLQAGIGAYGEATQAEQRRQAIERQQQEADRIRGQEDEDRAAQKRVNGKIQEITSGWDETTTPEQRILGYQSAANVAFASGDSSLGRGLIEAARLTIAGPEAGPTTDFTNYSRIKFRGPDGEPTEGRMREVTQPNGEVTQVFEHIDRDIRDENLVQGMSADEAQMAAWRVGGYEVDPAEERRLREEGEDEAGKRDMSGKMAFAARDANRSFVIDQDTGERVDLDFEMAGAVPIDWDEEGNAIDWRKGEVGDWRFWQSFLGDVISNAGSETVGIGKKLFNSIVRTKIPTELLQAYTEALNFINPTVRFLSGAQMTNQEAMRYYNALLPMTGDSVENIQKKRRKRDVLTAAMGGEGITDAEVRKAREFLGIDPDAEMNHLFSQFGREDETGAMAMNYYLAILEDKVGETNTFTSAQLREMQAGGGGAGGGAGSGAPVTPSGPLSFNYGALDSIPSATDSIGGQ